VGFEPTISVFEGAKTHLALDRAAAVIGFFSFILLIYPTVFFLTLSFLYPVSSSPVFLCLLFLAEHYDDSIKENEMGKARRKNGICGKVIQGLGG
jgi:hypothetical protein